jgi:hypothetical protein
MGQDATSPYQVTYNTLSPVFTDDGSVWTCILPRDAMSAGSWRASSSSIGIDNAIPNSATVSVPSGTQALAYTVGYAGADALSGLQTLQLQEQLKPVGGSAGSFSTVCSVSPGGATSYSTSCSRNPTTVGDVCYRSVAYDRAGNVRTGTASCVTNVG